MTFKSNWEKPSQTILLEKRVLAAMIKKALPSKPPISYEILSGGCANLNIKLTLHDKNLLLRVYLRDKKAVEKEEELSHLLAKTVPVPTFYFVGFIEDYAFAITDYLEGNLLTKSLSPLLLKESGLLLAKMKKIPFTSKKPPPKDCISFATNCLTHPVTLHVLSTKTVEEAADYLTRYSSYLPDDTGLVHGDFDPSNILVKNDHIIGILDWEFAFEGSFLWDVANMLRYQMPIGCREAFLDGLQEGGIGLPKSWEHSVNLLNLISLLDCLTRSNPEKEPIRCLDIKELIQRIILR
jgi:aminoglycoside phosphotransferase (APT) family kinase protein